MLLLVNNYKNPVRHTMHPMLNIAVRAARKTGNLITKYYENPTIIQISSKGKNDFVTNVDREAEHLIIEVIRKSYPKHWILSEERGRLYGENNDIEWLIDPLDGTTNFIKRLPHFSISIAVRIKGKTEIGVVYDPMRNELFTTVRGQGAQLNNYRIRCSDKNDIDDTILATGFPLTLIKNNQSYLNVISKLSNHCADFRRSGSAALDLAYVASGRVDGYFTIGLKPWDFAAGELIVRESGGMVTDFFGDHSYFSSGNIVAGNPRIVKSLLAHLRNEPINDAFS